MFTDMVGYTALMEKDEILARHKRNRHREVFEASHQKYGGEIIQYFGDGTLSIFSSALQAVLCAIEMQKAFREGNPLVAVRIGLHQGDILVEKGDVIGTSVNIASRVESFALPGSILLSNKVRQELDNHPDIQLASLGEFQFKNVTDSVTLYAIKAPELVVPDPADLQGKGTAKTGTLINLPHHSTSFIGRQEEVKAVSDLLEKARLVTLTGPGGTGKTRLSIEVARRISGRYADGVAWVPLATITSEGLVPAAIMQVLELKQDAERPMEDVLKDYLRDKKLLLVLDNFEQIIQAAPSLQHLLEQCPDLRFLVTSRIVLRLPGEWEYALAPLHLPDTEKISLDILDQNEAVSLFCQRAQQVKHQFRLTSENAEAVVSICRQLDGLPLAIELASARVKIFTPARLLGRLDKKLDVLKSHKSGHPDRQKTLRTTIQWSYDLLGEEEKELFKRMAIFSGGFHFEAAEPVCGFNGLGDWDIEDGVLRLLDHSLVQVNENREEQRFYMLETIRAFAVEELHKSASFYDVQRAHMHYFLRFAEEGASHLGGADQQIWLEKMDQEVDNLRAAIQFALQEDEVETAYRFGIALWRFWGTRSRTVEGIELLESIQTLVSSEDLKHLRIKVLQALGSIYFYTTPRKVLSKKIFEEPLAYWESIGNKPEVASTLVNLAWTELNLGLIRESIRDSNRALKIFSEIEDKSGLARGHNNLGYAFNQLGNPKKALEHFSISENSCKKIKDERRLAYSRIAQSISYKDQGDYRTATNLIEEGVNTLINFKDQVGAAFGLHQKAICDLFSGNFASALSSNDKGYQVNKKVASVFNNAWYHSIDSLIKVFLENEEEALLALKEAEVWEKKADVYYIQCFNANALGQNAWKSGNNNRLKQAIDKLLQLPLGKENRYTLIPACEFMSRIFAWSEEWTKAAEFYHKAQSERRQYQLVVAPLFNSFMEELENDIKQALGRQKWQDFSSKTYGDWKKFSAIIDNL